MNKSLETLENNKRVRIEEITPLEAWERANNNTYEHGYEISGDLCYIIETALKRLEELEKAYDSLAKGNETLRKMLSKAIKKNEALELIKDKQVDITTLNCADTVEQYNVKENGFIPLTQEEFDLLKEVLL